MMMADITGGVGWSGGEGVAGDTGYCGAWGGWVHRSVFFILLWELPYNSPQLSQQMIDWIGCGIGDEVLKDIPCEGILSCCLFHIYAHHSLSTVDGFFREKLLERVVVLASLTLPERVLYLEIFRELFPFKNTLLTAHSQSILQTVLWVMIPFLLCWWKYELETCTHWLRS